LAHLFNQFIGSLVRSPLRRGPLVLSRGCHLSAFPLRPCASPHRAKNLLCLRAHFPAVFLGLISGNWFSFWQSGLVNAGKTASAPSRFAIPRSRFGLVNVSSLADRSALGGPLQAASSARSLFLLVQRGRPCGRPFSEWGEVLFSLVGRASLACLVGGALPSRSCFIGYRLYWLLVHHARLVIKTQPRNWFNWFKGIPKTLRHSWNRLGLGVGLRNLKGFGQR
jgi:hypothetical protein